MQRVRLQTIGDAMKQVVPSTQKRAPLAQQIAGLTPRAAASLVAEVRDCTLCATALPHAPRPILQYHPDARILIVGQAPGSKVQASGVPFDDASGDRLREWMGIDRETFYDRKCVALLPMGFCYPGTGKSGDLPPRPECAPAWRERLMAGLANIKLTLVVGQYAKAWHLPQSAALNITDTVKAWRDYGPAILPRPHPSPRITIWLKRNPWFGEEVLPVLRGRVTQILREE